MRKNIQYSYDVIHILSGAEKAEMVKVLKTQGDVFMPWPQQILNFRILQKGFLKTKYELLLANGARFFLWSRVDKPLISLSLRKQCVQWRYRPDRVHFRGHEGYLLFDKSTEKGNVVCRLCAALKSALFGTSSCEEEKQDYLVCKAPARLVRMFLGPYSNNG